MQMVDLAAAVERCPDFRVLQRRRHAGGFELLLDRPEMLPVLLREPEQGHELALEPFDLLRGTTFIGQ